MDKKITFYIRFINARDNGDWIQKASDESVWRTLNGMLARKG